MPNAKEAHPENTPPAILTLAYTGAGKTTNFLTIPGRKFAYLFDPNAIRTLAGFDVDYEPFYADVKSFAITSLAKKPGSSEKKGDKPQHSAREPGSRVYLRFERHLEESLDKGLFDDYDAILFDSCTTLLDMIMDRVLQINGREGQWPQEDDWGPQMNAFSKIVRAATASGKTVYFTGHVEWKQDDLTKKIFQTPVLTGKLKTKIPLLFSEIFFLEAVADSQGNVAYTCQTKPDRHMPLIRTSVQGLDYKEDISIDFNQISVEGQGLWGMLNKGTSNDKRVLRSATQRRIG